MTGRRLFLKGSYRALYLVLAGLWIAVGLFSLATTSSGGGSIGLGVVMLVMVFWTASTPIVEVFEDRVEVKAAPLAGRKLIPLDRISEVEERGKKLDVHAGPLKVTIPIGSLEPEEAEELVEWLGERARG